MTVTDRLDRIERFLAPPPEGWHLLPWEVQAFAALEEVKALRAELSAPRCCEVCGASAADTSLSPHGGPDEGWMCSDRDECAARSAGRAG